MTLPAEETQRPAAWPVLSALLISGFLLALPAGLLPLWGYHLNAEYGLAGNYFLALGLGVAAGASLARRADRRGTLPQLLAAGSFLAALALLLLSFATPPAQIWYQVIGITLTGIAAGFLNTAVFESIAGAWARDPAAVTLAGGILFGAGGVFAAILLSQCFEGNPTRLFAVVATLPAAAGIAYSRLRIPRALVPEVSVADAMRDLRSALAILFALLLFFQFAIEWSLAGWLPVYLIDRIGLSPQTAVALLAVYLLAIVGGRVAAAHLVGMAQPLISRGRLLALSAFFALFGCVALRVAGSRFGVVIGLLLTGLGFSAIYPLVAERIAGRFSYYHPGYFNGIFTFALMGGLLAPFVLGHISAMWGLAVIPLSVMIGSCAVFALVLLIWLGHRLAGG